MVNTQATQNSKLMLYFAGKKQPHLHFSITTLIPYFWQLDLSTKQGWLRMFYLDPNNYLK